MTTTTPDPVYETRPIKRGRRTKAEIEVVCQAMLDLLREEHPMTVRQVFYRLVSAGVIDKSESEYKTTVCRLLARMRRDGQIPYRWITDNTRLQRKPRTWGGLDELLRHTAHFYRRDIWRQSDVYVEVWSEKEAISGILYDVTSEYDVPLMVNRGFGSISFLNTAGEAINEIGKPTYIYFFGDHDPSGLWIERKVEEDIRQFAPDIDIHCERVAVTPEQVERWDLPTRPTKKSDSRSKGFKGESIEVDAIPPKQLKQIARRCIEQHVDHQALEVLKQAETSEREYLHNLSARFEQWGGGK